MEIWEAVSGPFREGICKYGPEFLASGASGQYSWLYKDQKQQARTPQPR